jgi:hypothetical protein
LDLLNANYTFFLGNSAGHSPALYVFLYFLDLLNAKYTFLAAKRFPHFPPAIRYTHSSLFHRQDPLEQALFGEKMDLGGVGRKTSFVFGFTAPII